MGPGDSDGDDPHDSGKPGMPDSGKSGMEHPRYQQTGIHGFRMGPHIPHPIFFLLILNCLAQHGRQMDANISNTPETDLT
jgi:hypothetical protein